MRDPKRPVATSAERLANPLIGLLAISLIVLPTLAFGLRLWNLIAALLLVTVVSTLFMLARAPARGRRLVLANDYKICPRCRYILSCLPDDGTCPECGRAYLHDTLKIIWRQAYEISEAVNTPSTPSPPSPHTHPASPTPPPGASTN